MRLLFIALALTAVRAATLTASDSPQTGIRSQRTASSMLFVLVGGARADVTLNALDLHSYYSDEGIDDVPGGGARIVQGFESAFDFFGGRRPPAQRCWRGFRAAMAEGGPGVMA